MKYYSANKKADYQSYYQSGFTMIEILVAMGVFAVIISIIGSITVSVNKSSRSLDARNRLTQEGQTAQRLLMGRISEAIYVYPADTTINLAGTTGGITTKNTINNKDQIWQVNKDPFIAMILPPEAPTYDAGSNIPNNCVKSSTLGGSSTTEGCYRFYAFYAVKRSDLTKSGLERSSIPPQDTLNEDAWVLMQYTANLFNAAGTAGWTPGYTKTAEGIKPAQIDLLNSPTNLYQGREGRVLIDYIQPQTTDKGEKDLFVAGSTPDPLVDDCVLFCVTKTPTPMAAATATTSATTRANNGQVDIRFRMQQKVNGFDKPFVVTGTDPSGAKTNPYIGGVVSPRNWWAAP